MHEHLAAFQASGRTGMASQFYFPALREVGFPASRRLLRLERLSRDPITGADQVTAVTGPVLTDGGTRIPGLPLGQARSGLRGRRCSHG